MGNDVQTASGIEELISQGRICGACAGIRVDVTCTCKRCGGRKISITPWVLLLDVDPDGGLDLCTCGVKLTCRCPVDCVLDLTEDDRPAEDARPAPHERPDGEPLRQSPGRAGIEPEPLQ